MSVNHPAPVSDQEPWVIISADLELHKTWRSGEQGGAGHIFPHLKLKKSPVYISYIPAKLLHNCNAEDVGNLWKCEDSVAFCSTFYFILKFKATWAFERNTFWTVPEQFFKTLSDITSTKWSQPHRSPQTRLVGCPAHKRGCSLVFPVLDPYHHVELLSFSLWVSPLDTALSLSQQSLNLAHYWGLNNGYIDFMNANHLWSICH